VNEKILRLIILVLVTALHITLVVFVAFNVKTAGNAAEESARVMKLTDLAEAPPPPEEESLPKVEEIAEVMIETDTPPAQTVVAAGTLQVQGNTWDDYLPAHRVSQAPQFDTGAIAADLVYPPIAQRSGIEGRVMLELFVDRNGQVQRVTILLENPKDRGFGEAAVRAFSGRKGKPAMANGEAVSCRYRWPVSFTLK
jgi:protein TonB